ncbi:MAG: hypothetical protein JRJ68_12795 [Deltaproteobacteria bacterium]|nr:hypothetical protein [Deltaproteobacteria bacterium]
MRKIRFITLLSCFPIIFTCSYSMAAANEQVTSEFSNPAQAAHAANLSAAASAEINDEIADAETDVENAETAVTNAETAVTNAKAAEDQSALEAAEEELAKAEKTLTGAETTLGEAVAELAGVTVGSIEGMRSSGMGWGEIAHELGVHPGTLGLGHTKHNRENIAAELADDLPSPQQEIAEATKRDMQHGWSKGHGMSTSTASSSKKGLGLAETDLGVGGWGSKAAKENKGNSGNKTGNARGGASSKNSSANSSQGHSMGSHSSSGGPSNEKGNNGNHGHDKGNSGGRGNSGKSK